MRIVRFFDENDNLQVGREIDDVSAEIMLGDILSPRGLQSLAPTGQIANIKRRLAPLLPNNIFCIGRNYAEHAKEGNAEIPTSPVIFMKPTTTMTNPDSPVIIPACTSKKGEVDYEAELVVVIGTAGRNIPEEKALDHVLGYTCGNDISARKWQKHSGGGQWIRGKSFDTFCPLGPVLLTADEIPDPQSLRISTTLNGKTMQDDTTANMIFTVAHLISFISQDTTLIPGSIIMTGTPSGVGFARKPPVWLTPNDSVTVSISKIGSLTNPIESA